MIQVEFYIRARETRYYRSYSELAMQQLEPYIRKLCWKYTIRNIDPDDLAQELRLQVWSRIGLYNPTRASFKAWAYTVMRNYIVDLHRKVNKKSKNMLDADGRLVHNLDFEELEIDNY